MLVYQLIFSLSALNNLMFCLIDFLRQKPFLILALCSFSSFLLMPCFLASFRGAAFSLVSVRGAAFNLVRSFSVTAMEASKVNQGLL